MFQSSSDGPPNLYCSWEASDVETVVETDAETEFTFSLWKQVQLPMYEQWIQGSYGYPDRYRYGYPDRNILSTLVYLVDLPFSLTGQGKVYQYLLNHGIHYHGVLCFSDVVGYLESKLVELYVYVSLQPLQFCVNGTRSVVLLHLLHTTLSY
jgi:hypothetical protein